MSGGAGTFLGGEQFFEELFPRAHAGINYIDVLPWIQAGKPDHIQGQVHYFNRFAHIQDKDFAAPGHGPGLDYQLDGFGNGHEVALHLRVGHRYGSAGGNLPAEKRHHAAVAAQHVAEADGGEDGFAGGVFLPDNEFGQSFGGAHDAGGIDRLVGGNHYKHFGPEAASCPGCVAGAQDVCLHCFGGVELHQGHVFMGGGMEDNVRPVLLEDCVYPGLVPNIGNLDGQGNSGKTILQIQTDAVDAVFAVAQEHQFFGIHCGHLAAELGADGAAGAGD
ncbi:MAG: hypothetical protein BWY80_00762 [Firmicutes bacterium ADurb.Bin456]|nr:MAG: hypothetical protein BWY80_00762 [Firmicutes bacterium ADurb.Bin456]